MIILFDGCDKVGKGTLINAIHKVTDYEHVIFDRGIASNYVYGKFKKRKHPLEELLMYDEELSKHKFVKQIILVADKKDLIKRFKKHNETDLKLNEISKVLKLYNEYSNITRIDTLVLDTSKNSLQSCVNQILKWINK